MDVLIIFSSMASLIALVLLICYLIKKKEARK
ncbi:MAG: hypothetical protein MRERV_5c060 [Mycoplasmataceae bacterium RV_VA103A]|nr:MAG: hypothetical protein MRERV_5c060 [Mycoplasmataceae bacterium RV_VA103A]